ncbi:MAG: NAD(P)-binding domain-containing protein, partial [Gemmatimonadetes bacterium]|nr:NAD(P)-binding domain-containing protein [Gemmatimonadota bacterium]
MQDVRRITVVGVGLMGHGIALEFAAAGYDVRVNDVSPQALNAAIKRIEAGLHMLADLG